MMNENNNRNRPPPRPLPPREVPGALLSIQTKSQDPWGVKVTAFSHGTVSDIFNVLSIEYKMDWVTVNSNTDRVKVFKYYLMKIYFWTQGN